jgi:hypothetical protein
MPARVTQDAATEAGRRAKQAGQPMSACPYPKGFDTARRWCAGWFMGKVAKPKPTLMEPAPERHTKYSGAETASIARMLAAGYDSARICAALAGRSKKSVEVKISKIRLADEDDDWSSADDALLTALVEQGKGVTAIENAMGRRRSPVERAIRRLGLRLKSGTGIKRSKWAAA